MALKIHWRLEWKRLPVTLRAGVAMTVAAFALIVSVHAAPAPKSAALRTVRMVQQSIPMADGVHLSATLYMPDSAKANEKFLSLIHI